MKEEKKEKKLLLKKITIQRLDAVLDRNEQKTIKGGTNIIILGTTDYPVFCKPYIV